MKKRDPLSTAETMKTSTSPRQKPSKGCDAHTGFSGGLVGWVLGLFHGFRDGHLYREAILCAILLCLHLLA